MTRGGSEGDATSARRMRAGVLQKDIEKLLPQWKTLVDTHNTIITDEKQAKTYLTDNHYLHPTEEPTVKSLAYSLMLLSLSPNVSLLQLATRSLALLLYKVEEDKAAEGIADKLIERMAPIFMEIDDIKNDLKEAALTTQKAQQEEENRQTEKANNREQLYRAAVVRNLPKSHSQTVERRDFQRKLTLIDPKEHGQQTSISEASEAEIVKRANEAVEHTGMDWGETRKECVGARKLRNGGIILEWDSEGTADIIRRGKHTFCREFAEEMEMKERTYTVRAELVPTSHDVNSEWERGRIEEVNHLERNSLKNTKWIKPPERRRPNQQTAFLYMEFNTPDAANRAIRNGVIIQGKRVRASRKEALPIRCLRCQRYGHIAAHCKETHDTCPTCDGRHRKDDCQVEDPKEYSCANCKKKGHAAWDRMCPKFQEMARKMKEGVGEHTYKFFPTKEEWTWEQIPERSPEEEWEREQLWNAEKTGRTQQYNNSQDYWRAVDSPRLDSEGNAQQHDR